MTLIMTIDGQITMSIRMVKKYKMSILRARSTVIARRLREVHRGHRPLYKLYT